MQQPKRSLLQSTKHASNASRETFVRIEHGSRILHSISTWLRIAAHWVSLQLDHPLAVFTKALPKSIDYSYRNRGSRSSHSFGNENVGHPVKYSLCACRGASANRFNGGDAIFQFCTIRIFCGH
jgi:hypothetical protein